MVPPEPPPGVIDAIVAPEQIVCNDGVAVTTFAVVFTVTAEVIAVPVQPFAVGVMVKVTVTEDPLLFVNVPVILPEPLDAMPVTELVLFLVQAYVVPLAVLLIAMGVIIDPEQIVCEVVLAVAVTLGFTNTVAAIGVPVQVLAVGVTVNVTFTGSAVVFVKDPLIVPVPLAAIPVIAALSFVQLYIVELRPLVKAIAVIAEPEQTVCDDGVATVCIVPKLRVTTGRTEQKFTGSSLYTSR